MNRLVRRFAERFYRILHSNWLPWILVGAMLLVVLLQLARGQAGSAVLPAGQLVLWVIAVGSLLTAYLTINRLHGTIQERRSVEAQLAASEARVQETYHWLEALFRVSQQFVDAADENEVIEPVLRLIVDVSGADSAAFVPLDEHGQPQTVVSHGELPIAVMEVWLDYLTTTEVRDRCRECDVREPVVPNTDCPLLRGPFSGTRRLICFPVRRGEREFGILNLFLPESGVLEARTRILIGALLEGAAMGLDGVYLRRRELSALRRLQFLRQQSDLTTLLNGLLENVSQTLDADLAVLVVPPSDHFPQGVHLVEGDLPSQARPLVDGLLQGVMTSREAVLLGDLAGDPAGDPEVRLYLKSLVAAPLLSAEHDLLGALLVGNRLAPGKSSARIFQPRQLALLQTIAGQVALVVQNARLMAELEYQTMLQERARLAREIHDGLAQTIGFLKLQAAQLRSQLALGHNERALRTADLFYSTLTEAYQDARQAIDGLRISPDTCGLTGWLAQIAGEFQELSGLPVSVEGGEIRSVQSPEVQAQLIRIVQEALSNVRKHAHATQVWIGCNEINGDLVLEVRDNGRGFAAEDLISASQHGLRGMRERSDLIGADFQVVARPGTGAIVRVRLPIRPKMEVQA